MLCGIAVACCVVIAVWLPSDRQHVAQIFSDFRLQLPAFAQAVMDVPDLAIRIVAAILAAGVVTVQRLSSKRTAIDLHLVVIAFICVIVLIYRETVWQAFLQSIQGGTGGGRATP